jgi:PadR family transcriptional regulator, regulatory protein PadR
LSTVHAIDARPKNWSIPVALVVLREESSYGYTLMERLTGLGFEEINPGTLYRALRKMENEGLCDSGWETSEVGPACRAYSITGAGEAYLDSWARASERYQPVLDAFSLAYGRRRGTLPPAGERSESS